MLFVQLTQSNLSVSFQDPHIKVSGKKENVKEAKEKIMSVLDTKVR